MSSVTGVCQSLVLLIFIVLFSQSISAKNCFAQSFVDDATGVLGELGKIQVQVSGKEMTNQSIHLTQTTGNFVTPSQTFSPVISILNNQTFQSEEISLDFIPGLTTFLDVMGNVGSARLYNGNTFGKNGTSFGGGIRISPKQQAWLRVGFSAHVQRQESTFDNTPVHFIIFL